jgi:hypothetical protein
MSSKHNKNRKLWQPENGVNASNAENNFIEVLENYFQGTNYRVRKSPKDFNKIYINIPLTENVLSEIYTPEIKITTHGIRPDFAIDNLVTKKTIYGDSKRQDGWVEGKTSRDGRGNAHERMCKYFTPGIQKKLQEKGNISKNYLPFWIVLQGDITRDPKRVREITCWFDGNDDNYFFWRNSTNEGSLISHFENSIKHMLD